MLNLFRKKKNKNDMQERIGISIQELKKGRYSYASTLLDCFFHSNIESQKLITKELLNCLSNISIKQWYMLTDSYRSAYYMSLSNTRLFISKLSMNKYPYLSFEEYKALLYIGTFNWNGYFREACLRILSTFNGDLKYFYVRLNDWVKEIREYSAEALKDILKNCSFYNIITDMPVLEKVYYSKRRSVADINCIIDIIRTRISNELDINYLKKLLKEEVIIRNSFYNLGCKYDFFSREHIDFIIDNEPIGNSKERMLKYRISKYNLTEDDYKKYIKSKCTNVRYLIIKDKYEKTKNSWDGLEELLKDKSFKVRELAVFILKKHNNFDARKYYINLLQEGNIVVSLSSLGLHGLKEDADLVKKYMSSNNIIITRAALCSYGKLMGAEGNDVYWNYLCSNNTYLSKEAYHAIINNDIYYGADKIWDEYQLRHNKPTSRYFIYLLADELGWDKMKYLLELYLDKDIDESVRKKVFSSIKRRNMYSKISIEEANKLISIINEHRGELESIADDLLFDISIVSK